jgi:ATP-dependent DNA ligase
MLFLRAKLPPRKETYLWPPLFPIVAIATNPAYLAAMPLRERTRPGLGIIEPCLPSPAKTRPSGPNWIHEIKHDGFRIMARRDANGVRLYTRNGYNFASRFPQIVEAVSKRHVSRLRSDRQRQPFGQ